MNFFDHQDRARSSTKKLVFLFALAIIVLILMTSFLVVALFFVAEGSGEADPGLSTELLTSDIFLLVSLGVIAVVGLGSLYRFAQLRGGGKSVAEAMGGRLLNVSTRDADERKILNVVEEMALAAGLPVPPVYLIDDDAINAFAAGYQSQDAVIGITRGCIQILSREELQGVIAHEFSHIFNGDMRLNIRLMGLLYGIMVLGMIGYFIIRSTRYSTRRSRNNKGGGIIFLGFGLVVIGYGGTFFGNMIKAGVSRQREFLADASAVQFTRNPGGISGALKKIGGFSAGSKMNNENTAEISHMLFSSGLSSGFTGLFATHPPLEERILKIEPAWRGKFSEVSKQSMSSSSASSFVGQSEQVSAFASASRVSALDSIGNPSVEHLDLAVEQLATISDDIKAEAHNSFGASCLMYSLLIHIAEKGTALKQLALLEKALSSEHYKECLLIHTKLEDLPRELYLPLVDIALPALKELSPEQYRTFMSYLSQLIVADENINLFEWSVFKVLRYNLAPNKKFAGRGQDIYRLSKECEVLLSILAEVGHADELAAETSFNEAKNLLNFSKDIQYKPEYKRDTQALEKAVNKLKGLKPLQKPQFLKALVKCIDADGKVTPDEQELLRAVASLLDCPIPPLLSGQKFL